MPEIIFRNVCKAYENKQYTVKDFNLEIHDKEFIILVGPSGCGKSTTLRMLAGLEEITDGELWIDGELSNYLEPKDRGVSMVFQNYALYPNMTVYGNLAFALKVRKMNKKEIDAAVHHVAKVLEIEPLLNRRPSQLSGGQKQRVAIGSAITRKTKAFLMDEPLSNLDAKLRGQMRVELLKLHKELEATIIYVTHDQTEAMTLGTKIVVMKDGYIQQVDTPEKIYNHPVNLFVAGFIGSPAMNFFSVKACNAGEKVELMFKGRENIHKICLGGKKADSLRRHGLDKKLILGIRPEDICEYKEAAEQGFETGSGGIEVTINTREILGAEVMLYFEEQGRNHAVRLKQGNQTKPKEKITLYFNPDKVHVFDAETEKNLFYIKEKSDEK